MGDTFPMRMFALILIITSVSASASFASAKTDCLTTREFITTMEFLRSDDHFKMKDVEAQDTSFAVSAGCTGSAKRFIRIAKTLSMAGANRKSATDVALPFAKLTDEQTDAFVSAFKLSIAEDALDLDFQNSAKIALSISKDYSGDLKFARKDFEKIVELCTDTGRFAIPRKDCGPFAARIARSGAKWEKGAAEPFLETLEFLTSEKGPTLSGFQAVEWSEKITAQGPSSKENFKQAYQYAISSSGLKLNRSEAVEFAVKMASLDGEAFKTQTKATDQEPEQKQAKDPSGK